MKLSYYAKRYIDWLDPENKIKKDWRYNLIDNNLKPWDKVLDIWCASWGFFNKWKHKNIDFSGIDYNEELVNFCNKQGLKVKQCDLSKENLPYDDNSFDFIYCSHVLEHLLSNEQIQLFSEIHRVLKKNGRIILFTPTPYTWYFRDDPTHQRPSTHGSLEHLAKDFNLKVIASKYSNTRFFHQKIQTYLRLPPLRWFLWEVYLVAKKV